MVNLKQAQYRGFIWHRSLSIYNIATTNWDMTSKIRSLVRSKFMRPCNTDKQNPYANIWLHYQPFSTPVIFSRVLQQTDGQCKYRFFSGVSKALVGVFQKIAIFYCNVKSEILGGTKVFTIVFHPCLRTSHIALGVPSGSWTVSLLLSGPMKSYMNSFFEKNLLHKTFQQYVSIN